MMAIGNGPSRRKTDVRQASRYIVVKKQNSLVTKDHRLSMIRDRLINEYIGLSTGEVVINGNEKFRQRLLGIVEEFNPGVRMPLPYGLSPQLYSSSKEDSAQASKNVIAQQNWEFVVGIKEWEGHPEEIHQYTRIIKDIAAEYGLRPKGLSEHWWGYDWLHDVVSHTIQHLIDTGVNLIEKRWWAGKAWGEFTPPPSPP